MLRRRQAAGLIRLGEPIFADAEGSYRDPANVRRSLRTSLTPVGSIARRDLGLKTTATILDDDGRTARQIADQLGHARVS